MASRQSHQPESGRLIRHGGSDSHDSAYGSNHSHGGIDADVQDYWDNGEFLPLVLVSFSQRGAFKVGGSDRRAGGKGGGGSDGLDSRG